MNSPLSSSGLAPCPPPDRQESAAPEARDTSEPRVSVLMAVHNGADYVGQSLDSILAQTVAAIEVIVVDDCSTDDTAAIVTAIDDPRLRLVRNPRNLGVVGARCRGIAAARAPYICVVDHDDLVFPTRFARQLAFLEAHPGIVMVGTCTHILDGNQIVSTRRPAFTDPLFLRWSLLTTNPIVHSSIMFRASALRALDAYLREDFIYAEDFEFFHRLLDIGEIGCLDEVLTVYRRHAHNISSRRESEMIKATARVLERSYRPWLDDEAGAAARLVASQLTARRPAATLDELRDLGQYLDRLRVGFATRHAPAAIDRERLDGDAARLWWRAVSQAAQSGLGGARALYASFPDLARSYRPSPRSLLLARLHQAAPVHAGKSMLKRLLRPAAASVRPGVAAAVPLAGSGPVSLPGARLSPAEIDTDIPPTLYVVIDTEAEFDWSQPFCRTMTSVGNLARQQDAQAIFEHFGIRPIYVIDYPVASQPEGYGPLRAMLDRRTCEIGMHLHPWTCPPFDEPLSDWNSYPGNLPRDIEARKIETLAGIIAANLGVRPRFYKAGRYGFGPHSAAILNEIGISVDFSLLPETDLRHHGGMDCRRVRAIPYHSDSGILFVPMTRAHTGLLGRTGAGLSPLLGMADRHGIPLRGILSRVGLINRITLTPEGIDLAQNIHLIRSLLRRGHRTFVMHYHSPSLVPGHTPYARDEAGCAEILRRIEGICRYFIEIGGFPGNPGSLDRARPDSQPRPDSQHGRS